MAGPELPSFHWADYLIFMLMLLASCAIGVYYACTGGKQKTTGEYIMGDRQMNFFVVSLSIMVSNISAILILGIPAEIYTFGGRFWMSAIGSSIGAVLAALIFVPLFYPLKLTSVHEYLLLRYKSKWPQYLATVYHTLGLLMYTAVVLFAPATAIEAVTGFPTWASIAICGGVSTIYTTIGGFKAVVWTDAFQSLIMLAGCVAIVIQGGLKIGGFSRVWQLSGQDGRLKVFDFNPDPRERVTFWSMCIGGTLLWTAILGVHQPAVQRYSALSNCKVAMWSVLTVIPGHKILLTCALLSGLAVYAFYASQGCDPLAAGYISNPNQIIPYFVMDTMKFYGVPGLFMSCVCAGSLSSASSSLNSAAATTWQDIIKDFYPKGVGELKAVIINKGLVVMFGCLASLFAFAMMGFGGNVVQLISIVNSCVNGPHFGMFLLGCVLPWTNWVGATTGGLAGLFVLIWINIGSYMAKKHLEFLPSRTENCSIYSGLENSTLHAYYMPTNYSSTQPYELSNLNTIGLPDTHSPGGLQNLYSMSFLWLASFGAVTTIVVGIVVSMATGATPRSKVDKRLMLPLVAKICPCITSSFQDPDLDYLNLKKDILIEKPPIEMSNVIKLGEKQNGAQEPMLQFTKS